MTNCCRHSKHLSRETERSRTVPRPPGRRQTLSVSLAIRSSVCSCRRQTHDRTNNLRHGEVRDVTRHCIHDVTRHSINYVTHHSIYDVTCHSINVVTNGRLSCSYYRVIRIYEVCGCHSYWDKASELWYQHLMPENVDWLIQTCNRDW